LKFKNNLRIIRDSSFIKTRQDKVLSLNILLGFIPIKTLHTATRITEDHGSAKTKRRRIEEPEDKLIAFFSRRALAQTYL